MSAVAADCGRPQLIARIDRLEAELEQAEVAREDILTQLSQSHAANAELVDRLRDEQRLRTLAERRLSELMDHPPIPPASDRSQEDVLRNQLSVTLEELSVMAEEFQLAQDQLRRLQPHEADLDGGTGAAESSVD